jgi:manganese transport protein
MIEERDDKDHLGSLPTEGWRRNVSIPSLPEAFRSIAVPLNGSWLRRLFAFIGPGYLVAVGYMDPGNWATDIGGGAKYAYALLSVVLISNFIAVFLQALSAKLGIVTGRDLAQACHDAYSPRAANLLWISAEVAIVACDVAEVLGAAIALNLLFGINLIAGVVLTAADVLLVLGLQSKGFRIIEVFVITLIATMMGIFAVELGFAHADWAQVAHGFIPTSQIVKDGDMLFLALGILGATVMPHNLYLHSSIIQTRRYGNSLPKLKEAIRLAYTDSTIALTLALFVNAAILVLAAAAFYNTPHRGLDDIEQAYKFLTPVLGASLATPLFAIALLASGQNSTITGTMAGQVVLEGFTRFRIQPWKRRLISRCIAIVPSVAAVAMAGHAGLAKLMVFSQVVLSAQLSFAVIPLVMFTSDRRKMGSFVNGAWTKTIGWTTAMVILGLNVYLIVMACEGKT